MMQEVIMSAAQRNLARLPLTVYGALRDSAEEDELAIALLREEICTKLKAFAQKRSSNGVASLDGVTTVGELLQLSQVVLLRILDPLLTYSECNRFIEQISICCAPQPRTALTLLKSSQDASGITHIPTSLVPLDTHLKGGVRVGTITEIVGHASAGKTQLAMQLAVNAARYRQGCIYIDTEQKLSLPRLRAIATKRAVLYNHQSSVLDYRHVLSNVTIHSPTSTDELRAVLSCLEDGILACEESEGSFPVRLIVLDSIAAPIRRDFGSGSAPQRAAAVIQSAQILKRLADQYTIAVVVINQTGKAGAFLGDEKAFDGEGGAALGTSWHHCVTTRIQLEQLSSQQSGDQTILRRCSVVKSNIVAPADFAFKVTDLGLVDD